MMESKFKAGQVVALNSESAKGLGGESKILMTIEQVAMDTSSLKYSYKCLWMNQDKELKKGSFVEETLSLQEL